MKVRAHSLQPGPYIGPRTAMDEYIGLDVSLKDTALSIRRAGKRIWRGKCASGPQLLAALIRKHAPAAKWVVFETGPLSVWLFDALTAEGLPAICIDARHAKAALDMAANKTDANDADGLAHLAEVGFYKEVRVKSFDSMLARTLVAARTRLVRIGTELSNQIRGRMKTFGLIVPAVSGTRFERLCGRFARWQRRTGSDHPANAGGVACGTSSRCGARTQAAGRCQVQRGLPATHDDPGGRCRDGDLLHHGY
jgi:transposase